MKNENIKGFWKKGTFGLVNKDFFDDIVQDFQFYYYLEGIDKPIFQLDSLFNFSEKEYTISSIDGDAFNGDYDDVMISNLINALKQKLSSLNFYDTDTVIRCLESLNLIIKKYNEGKELNSDELVLLYGLEVKNIFKLTDEELEEKRFYDYYRNFFVNHFNRICNERNHEEDFQLIPLEFRYDFLKKYCDFELKSNDPNLVIEYGSLKFADDSLIENKNFIKKFMANNKCSFVFPFTKSNVNSNKQIVMEHLSNIASQKYDNLLTYLSDYLKDDEDVVRLAIKINGNSIKDASDRLKNNKDIVILALLNGCDVKEENFPLIMLEKYAEIKKIADIIDIINVYSNIEDVEVKRVLSNNIVTLIKHSPPELKSNYRMMKKIFAINSETFNFASSRVQNKLRGR